MIRVENVNGEFIENITLEYYESDEFLQKLYLDCMVDLYDNKNKTLKLYTQDEFKLYEKEQKEKNKKNKEEKRKIQNERSRNYYQKNKEVLREKLNKYYKDYREKKKLNFKL